MARALGDVVFVEVPIIGDTVKKNGDDHDNKRDNLTTSYADKCYVDA